MHYPLGPTAVEQLPQPAPKTLAPAVTVRSLPPFDLLSKTFLQSVVNHLSERSGKSVGLIIASKTGRVAQSVHCGWDASRIRTQQRTIAKIARELTLAPVARYSVDATKVHSNSEIKHCGSVFLNELAQSVQTPLYLVPIALKGSLGSAIVYCEVPTTQAANDADFVGSAQHLWCDPVSLNSLTQQLDAWLMVQHCDWTLRAIRAVDWIRSRPRWWLAPLAVLGSGLFAPIPYYPRRECIFEPESKQFLASPIAGRIMSCEVRPGDAVDAGQLLARLDDDQLQRDLATAKAEYDGALKKRDSALATRAAGSAGLADIEMKQAQWRIESIEDHLRRLEIRAKAPGVVVQGDWHRSVGMPVTLGQSLFEVAELESMVAEVRLKATDLGQINVGDEVSVRSDASGPCNLSWQDQSHRTACHCGRQCSRVCCRRGYSRSESQTATQA